jgi:hypothetical protein
MDVPAPDWLLVGAAVVSALGAVGAVVALARRRDSSLALLFGFAAAAELTVLGIGLQCNESCWQGRYLFTAAAPLAVLAAVGLRALLPRSVALLVPVGAAIVAAWMPFGVIAPAYSAVPLPKSSLAQIQHPLDVRVGEAFELEGYSVAADQDARTVVATLYWRSWSVPDFDYTAFVHLVDAQGRLVAQQDKPPGVARNYPPRQWWPQDIVRDEHVLWVPAGAGDGPFTLRIGLYNWQTGERLPVWPYDEGADRSFVPDTPLTLPPVGSGSG